MTRQIAFLILLLLSTFYASVQGGKPERIGAATLFAGAWLSAWVVNPRGPRFHQIETGILLTDMAILGIFLWLSIRSARFWPVWIAAMLGAEVLVHLGLIIAPSVHWKAYMDATAMWSWLAQFMMIAATWRHRRRLGATGVDVPWKH